MPLKFRLPFFLRKNAMISNESELYTYFDELGITYTTKRHPALYTVEEGRALKTSMPGGHTKNLFMKDKDETIVLISAHAESVLPLNKLHKQIGTRRLSFASPELMKEILGVTPGSVTAFALVNDLRKRVKFVVDKTLMEYEILNFHPLDNTATTAISRTDFTRFIEATGHSIQIVDFDLLSTG